MSKWICGGFAIILTMASDEMDWWSFSLHEKRKGYGVKSL